MNLKGVTGDRLKYKRSTELVLIQGMDLAGLDRKDVLSVDVLSVLLLMTNQVSTAPVG